MKSADLEDQTILLLLLERSNTDRIAVVTGTGHWNGAQLEVAIFPGKTTIPVVQAAVERDGFDPAVLPRLVGDDRYLAMAERWADEVAWCAPMLVETVPLGLELMPGFLGGLAMGRNGELLLMQVR